MGNIYALYNKSISNWVSLHKGINLELFSNIYVYFMRLESKQVLLES